MENIKVNDGGGLYDNIGLIDTLIVDCNELLRAAFSGQYVRFSSIIVGMTQKLANLKNGVSNDMDALKKQLDDLRRFVDDINAAEGGNTDV